MNLPIADNLAQVIATIAGVLAATVTFIGFRMSGLVQPPQRITISIMNGGPVSRDGIEALGLKLNRTDMSASPTMLVAVTIKNQSKLPVTDEMFYRGRSILVDLGAPIRGVRCASRQELVQRSSFSRSVLTFGPGLLHPKESVFAVVALAGELKLGVVSNAIIGVRVKLRFIRAIESEFLQHFDDRGSVEFWTLMVMTAMIVSAGLAYVATLWLLSH